MATNSNIEAVQDVFGSGWQPASAFTPELQEQGIVGAVRIKGTNEVYTLGSGGGHVSAEKFLELFGTAEQGGIVGEVSAEEARALGIRAPGTERLYPKQPEVLTPEMLTGGEGEIRTGDVTGDVAGIGVYDKTADTQSRIDTLELQIKEAEAKEAARIEVAKVEKEALEKEKEPFYQRWKELLVAPISKKEELGKSYEELGISPASYMAELKTGYNEISALRISYNEVLEKMGLKIDAVEQLGMPSGYTQGAKARTERQYNSRLSTISANISAKASVLSAKQGLMAEARAFATESVEASIWDYQTEVSNLTAFLSLNEDKISQLSTDIKKGFDDILANKKSELADIKTEKDSIMNLILDAANKGIDLHVDLSTVTLDEVTKIYTEKVAAAVAAEKAKEKAGVTYAPTQYEKEWNAAGGETGTGLSLSAYIMQRTGVKAPTPVPEWFSKEMEEKLGWRIPQPYPTKQIKEAWAMYEEPEAASKEETIWAWLASPEAQTYDDEEKKNFIMNYGLDPEKFNIY